MSHWPFVLAAYAVALIAPAALALVSYSAMRRGEAEANALRSER